MIHSIYQIRNTRDGKVYVGQAQDTEKRWKHHTYTLEHHEHRNRYLQHAWDLYGESSFIFEILEICPIRNLNKQEQIWLDRTQAYIQTHGYNFAIHADAPFRGLHHSPEARAKKSTTLKGHVVSPETRAKISKAHQGKVISKEARAKISAANKGRIVSSETRAKLRGRHHSAESRAKISAAHKGVPKSPEHRAKLALASKNPSAELRARMSIAQRASMTPERRSKIAAAHRGMTASAETRKKMSESHKKQRQKRKAQSHVETA